MTTAPALVASKATRAIGPADSLGSAWSPVTEGGLNDGDIHMSKTLLYGFAALALTVLVWPADQARAITHGCTDPPDITNLVLNMDLDGQKSRVSGKLCAVIQKAVAAIQKSSMNKDAKQAAIQAIVRMQDRTHAGATAGRVHGTVNGWVNCGQGQGCSGGVSGGIVF